MLVLLLLQTSFKYSGSSKFSVSCRWFGNTRTVETSLYKEVWRFKYSNFSSAQHFLAAHSLPEFACLQIVQTTSSFSLSYVHMSLNTRLSQDGWRVCFYKFSALFFLKSVTYFTFINAEVFRSLLDYKQEVWAHL